MIDFGALDRDTRTIALVGRFLQLWATMENLLGQSIGTALNLTNLARFIIAANIGFTNKLFVLGALCSVSSLPDEEKKAADKLIGQIQSIYGLRNIVAHENFRSSEASDGVEFLAMKAKGKVAFPDADWSVEYFQSLFDRLSLYIFNLDALNKRLSKAKILSPNTLAQLLAGIPAVPTEGFSGLGLLDLLGRPPQADHTSATTAPTPETDAKTHPSPQE